MTDFIRVLVIIMNEMILTLPLITSEKIVKTSLKIDSIISSLRLHQL